MTPGNPKIKEPGQNMAAQQAMTTGGPLNRLFTVGCSPEVWLWVAGFGLRVETRYGVSVSPDSEILPPE